MNANRADSKPGDRSSPQVVEPTIDSALQILNRSRDVVRILGVNVDRVRVGELHELLASFIDKNERALVLNANVHCLNLAAEHVWLREFLNGAEVVFCDGAGVAVGARMLGHKMPPRITYADWMWQLAEFCVEREYTLYFLGAKPGVAEKAAARLQETFPSLRVIGTQHGYFDHQPDSHENSAVIDAINELRPNILVLGFGMPLQERWLMENWHRLNVNIALTGGAVFDYISGELKRAPEWMTDNGLEWLGRLLIEPGRLWRRYLVGNPRFLWRVLQERLRV